uniref:P-type ATPase N-terminal domain-containing protein n=1 Tax=Romanomermis culicivorax TaxID=13658 RepID=A0A915HLU6_ROMCU
TPIFEEETADPLTIPISFGIISLSLTWEIIQKTERRVQANNPEFNLKFKYAMNFIKTSKYSIITFLPKNLFEQFQRLANFYFLVLMILQCIPAISSLRPWTTIIPLCFVLMVTAVKDFYDDVQRHISDNQVNNRKTRVVRRGKLVEEKWQNVNVGDIIRMECNNFVATVTEVLDGLRIQILGYLSDF